MSALSEKFWCEFCKGNSWILLLISVIVIVILGQVIIRSSLGSMCVFTTTSGQEECPPWQCYMDHCRGHDYNLITDEEQRRVQQEAMSCCAVSVWAILHLITWFLLAFICPRLLGIFFLVGLTWELFEIFLGCQCWLDIGWNLLGLVAGYALRVMLFPMCGY